MFSSKSKELQEFDYRKTKEEFTRVQCDYIRRKSKDIIAGYVNLWTREKVEIYIDNIIEYKKKKESYLADEVTSNYDAVKMDGTYKLVLKNKRYRGQRIEIVPFEDCFDVILPVHRRIGHNPHFNKIMFKVISRKYVIDKIWVFLMQRSCNFCKSTNDFRKYLQSDTIVETKYLNRCYCIAIVPPTMKDISGDKEKLLLMIVADRNTGFVCLRPVIQYDDGRNLPTITEKSVAVELVKVFTDYGVPKLIETCQMSLMERVMQILPNFDKQYKLHLLQIQANSKIANWHTQVIMYLKEWMKVNECDNWVSGCPIVQWQINNSDFSKSGKTPYQTVFNMEPVRDLIVG